MKTITIDDELYTFIASKTQHIGESASDILRRLLIENTEYNGSGNVTSAVESTTPDVKEPKTKPVSSRDSSIPLVSSKKPANANSDVFSVLEGMNLADFGSRVDLFLMILSALYQTNQGPFDKVLEVKGRNRLYFGTSKAQLLESGSSTNPKQVPESEFWVVTNNNTAKKSSMLRQVAEVLGYSEAEQEKLVAIFTR